MSFNCIKRVRLDLIRKCQNSCLIDLQYIAGKKGIWFNLIARFCSLLYEDSNLIMFNRLMACVRRARVKISLQKRAKKKSARNIYYRIDLIFFIFPNFDIMNSECLSKSRQQKRILNLLFWDFLRPKSMALSVFHRKSYFFGI